MRRGVVGLELQDLPEFYDGFGKFFGLQQRITEIVMGLGKFRIGFHRLRKLRRCVRKAA